MAYSKKARQKAFLKTLEMTKGNREKAFALSDVSSSTFYDWMKTDPVFRESVEDLLEITIDHVEDMLHDKIDDGDTTAIIFFLKTRGKRRGYVEKQEVEHSAKDGLTIVVNNQEQKEKLDKLGGLEI